MEGVHAVRGEEDAATVLDGAPQLAHGRRRIGYVLQHLEAEHDVEARVLDRDRVDRAVQVRVRVAGPVEADDLGRTCQKRVVGTIAAADVEHAQSPHVLRCEPVEQRLAYGVLHGRADRTQAPAHSVRSLVAASPKVSQVRASSGMPATKPCAVQSQARTAMARSA